MMKIQPSWHGSFAVINQAQRPSLPSSLSKEKFENAFGLCCDKKSFESFTRKLFPAKSCFSFLVYAWKKASDDVSTFTKKIF